MSRNKFIARYSWVNDNNTWGSTIYWDKNLLQVFEPPLTLVDFETTERIAPNYIDQYTDGTTLRSIWADWSTAFQPASIDVSAAHDYTKAITLQVDIHQPVIIDKYNGYIKVRGRGADSETYDYTLNLEGGGSMINQSGVFTAVPVGDHLLTVTDQILGASKSLIDHPLTMPEAPVYATRFKGEFTDINGGAVLVEIQRKGYQGVAEEICLGGSPLSVSTDVIGDDFIAGIVPTDIQIAVIQDYDGQFNDLFITDSDYWTVKITSDSGINMTGLLMTEQSSIDHHDNPIIIQLNAMAGLTNMGDIPVEGWSGAISFADVFGAIQTQYNTLQYNIRDYVGLREETDPSSYLWEFMRRYKVNAAMFNELTPKDALNKILDSLNCSLTHSFDNHLHVQTVAISTLVGQTIQGAIYQPNGSFVNYHPMTITAIDIDGSRTKDAFYIEGGQQYGYLPMVNKFSIANKYTDGETWLAPMRADDFVVISDNPSAAMTQIDTRHIRLHGKKIGRLYSLQERAGASLGGLRVYGTGIRLKISYSYMANEQSNTNALDLIEGEAGLIAMLGTERCLNSDGELDFNVGHLYRNSIPKTVEWNDFDVEARTFTPEGYPQKSGYLKLWLFGFWRNWQSDDEVSDPNYVDFKDIQVEVLLPEDHEELNLPLEMDLGNDGIDIGEITSEIGDAPDSIGYGVDLGGVIVKEDLSLTSSWRAYSQSTARPFKQYLADNIILLRSKNVKRLSGSLFTGYPQLGAVIYDKTVAGGFFMPQHFAYDVKFNKLSFSALEITASTGDRLLEDGEDRLLEDTTKRLLQ